MFPFLTRAAEAPADETQAAPEAKSRAGVRAVAAALGGTGGTRSGAALVRAGFTANPVAFRAVRLIAEAAASLPMTFEEAGARLTDHPVLTLLSDPNAGQGQAELMEAIYGQMLLSGNAFVEGVAGEEGLPLELNVLRSDRMRVVAGSDGWPVGYDYAAGSKTRRFGTHALCHIRAFHPLDDHYGFSPLQACAQALEVHNAATRWSRALLENAARPSGAIVYNGIDGHGQLSADQYDRLLSEMEAQHQGARNAGRPMLLEGGLDWKPMGFSPTDMEFQKTKDAAARDIAIAFGVPPMLLGIPGDATYANYQEANRAFYRLTVLPLAQKVTRALSDWLTGGSAVLAPDLDQVSALAQERAAQWGRIGAADFLTEAEKRRLLGLPERPE